MRNTQKPQGLMGSVRQPVLWSHVMNNERLASTAEGRGCSWELPCEDCTSGDLGTRAQARTSGGLATGTKAQTGLSQQVTMCGKTSPVWRARFRMEMSSRPPLPEGCHPEGFTCLYQNSVCITVASFTNHGYVYWILSLYQNGEWGYPN